MIMAEDLERVQSHVYFVLKLLVKASKKKDKEQIFLSLDYMKRILDYFIKSGLK